MMTITCGKYTATIEIKNKDHWIDYGIFEDSRFYRAIPFDNDQSTYAVIAKDQHGLASLWKFRWQNSILQSYFTWTAQRWRNQGLAFQLWCLGLDYFQVREIRVDTCSDKGYSLIQKIQETYPLLLVDHSECGGRKLRDIRKSQRIAL